MRDHLFISYATEDGVFARWLALRLSALGYRVWIDQFELLGGERYPSEIDKAIKERTFRFLALLSRASISKPNPVKERTLALNIARDRGEDFLIPLNLDALRPAELDWMTSDLTFIPFAADWAAGLNQLAKKLLGSGAPTLAEGRGPVAARAALEGESFLLEQPETLGSNLFPIVQWPEVLHQYRLAPTVGRTDLLTAAESWAFHVSSARSGERQLAFAFEDPPPGTFAKHQIKHTASAVWEETRRFEGIPTWNLIKPLAVRVFYLRCRQSGLSEMNDGSFVYFKDGILPRNSMKFRSYTGRKVRIRVVGERSFRGKETFRYHLGLEALALRMPGGDPFMKLNLRLFLTDLDGKPFEAAGALARRKSITRTWYNHQFYSRILGVPSFLEGADGLIRCGTAAHLVVSGSPVTVEAPVSIDEERLPKGRQPFRSGPAGEVA
jgi:hypothetical protein